LSKDISVLTLFWFSILTFILVVGIFLYFLIPYFVIGLIIYIGYKKIKKILEERRDKKEEINKKGNGVIKKKKKKKTKQKKK